MDNNTSRRAIISVTATDIDEITTSLEMVLKEWNSGKLDCLNPYASDIARWRDRFFSIREILTDHLPTHFTDLGIDL